MDVFCQINSLLTDQIIHETPHFFVIHDGYPLSEGHVLIIPKKHVDCFLHIDKEYIKELTVVKKNVTDFLTNAYKKPVVFEHGGIAQTVPHAHLHFLPTEKSIHFEIKKVCIAMTEKKAPYLYYEESGKSYYYRPKQLIEGGFLHVSFAKALSRPIVGTMRAKDTEKWTLQVKQKWNIWEEQNKEAK